MDSSEWLLFITTFIRRKNPITASYWGYITLCFMGVLYLFSAEYFANMEARFWIVGLTGGLLVSLLISPVLHESIHAMFFKLLGAKGIKFTWNWGLFRFNVQANDFVLSKRKYYLICLFTFALFSVLPFILALYTTGVVSLALFSLSFFHALYASKDLAVCSYLYKFPNCYIYSAKENKTVFYKTLP